MIRAIGIIVIVSFLAVVVVVIDDLEYVCDAGFVKVRLSAKYLHGSCIQHIEPHQKDSK